MQLLATAEREAESEPCACHLIVQVVINLLLTLLIWIPGEGWREGQAALIVLSLAPPPLPPLVTDARFMSL